MKRKWQWHNYDGQTRVIAAAGLVLAVLVGIATAIEIAGETGNGQGHGWRRVGERQETVHRSGWRQDQRIQNESGVSREAQGPAGAKGQTVSHDNWGDGHLVRLFAAIRQVESGGDDRAVGDGGRSVGPYQTGRLAWIDGGGKLADYPRLAYDRRATEKIMLAYWRRYGATTDEARCRIWNGGPRGMHKTATLAYWAKVRKEIQR